MDYWVYFYNIVGYLCCFDFCSEKGCLGFGNDVFSSLVHGRMSLECIVVIVKGYLLCLFSNSLHYFSVLEFGFKTILCNYNNLPSFMVRSAVTVICPCRPTQLQSSFDRVW